MNSPEYKGFTELFPTRIHKFKIAKELVNAATIGLSHRPENFEYVEVLNHPHYMELQAEVEKCATAIAPSSTCTDKWKVVTSWMNNQPPTKGGFDFHNHVDSFLSAVLYLKGCEISIGFRDDAKEAKPTSANTRDFEILIRHTWNGDENLDVEVGDLIFFPSSLLHKPNKNLTLENRISIAYNLIPSRYNAPDSMPWSMDFNP